MGCPPTLALVTIVQTAALLLMPGLTDLAAFAVALGIMLGVFGQVPLATSLSERLLLRFLAPARSVPDIWSAFLPFPVLCH